MADAYGVLVRAGAITPQWDDEVLLRGVMDLPDAGAAVKKAWSDDGGVRRAITIANAEATAPTK